MAQRHHRGTSKSGKVDESPPPPRRILGPTNCERCPQRRETRQHEIQHRLVGEVGDNPWPGWRRVVCLDSIQGRCGTDTVLEATCLPCPFLDVGPVPNECGVEVGHRLRKIIMPSTPIVNHLRASDSRQTSRNLCGSYEFFDIDVSTHAETIPPTADIDAMRWGLFVRVDQLGGSPRYNTGPNSFSRYGRYPPAGIRTPRRIWTQAVKGYWDATRVSEHCD